MRKFRQGIASGCRFATAGLLAFWIARLNPRATSLDQYSGYSRYIPSSISGREPCSARPSLSSPLSSRSLRLCSLRRRFRQSSECTATSASTSRSIIFPRPLIVIEGTGGPPADTDKDSNQAAITCHPLAGSFIATADIPRPFVRKKFSINLEDRSGIGQSSRRVIDGPYFGVCAGANVAGRTSLLCAVGHAVNWWSRITRCRRTSVASTSGCGTLRQED